MKRFSLVVKRLAPPGFLMISHAQNPVTFLFRSVKKVSLSLVSSFVLVMMIPVSTGLAWSSDPEYLSVESTLAQLDLLSGILLDLGASEAEVLAVLEDQGLNQDAQIVVFLELLQEYEGVGLVFFQEHYEKLLAENDVKIEDDKVKITLKCSGGTATKTCTRTEEIYGGYMDVGVAGGRYTKKTVITTCTYGCGGNNKPKIEIIHIKEPGNEKIIIKEPKLKTPEIKTPKVKLPKTKTPEIGPDPSLGPMHFGGDIR